MSIGALRTHGNVVRKYIAQSEGRLRALTEGRALAVLELGAGTCMTSLLLSSISGISSIVCLDVSLKKMQSVFPLSVQALSECCPEKISMVEGHFDAALPFQDGTFDVVVFDGALHHARSIWFVLEECRRVLRPGGSLIAQREQYLGTLTANAKLARLLRTEEVRAGVSENAYLRAQYEYYLRAVGFVSVDFLPVAETKWQAALKWLNGWLMSKWVIWATAPLESKRIASPESMNS
jgi:ubiquinone/menaquinone biosynthesis C-methylase UbiE